MSEEAVANPTTDGHQQLLKITIDGMDQSKFRCPRNAEHANMWANYWRPSFHTVGCIIEGILEVYLVANHARG